MGLFDLFKRKSYKYEPKTLPFGRFGTISRCGKDDWIPDGPTVQGGFELEVNYYIPDDDEPGPEHLAYYEMLIENWDSIWGTALQAIREDMAEWELDDSPREQFLKEVRPTGINVFCSKPKNRPPQNEPLEWEMPCDPWVLEHLVSIKMRGKECIGIGFDG